MKTIFVVINKSKDVQFKPYSHQYLAFSERKPLFEYLAKAGWGKGAPAPTLMGICLDPGFVNWFACGDIDLTVMRLEVK